VENKSAVWAVIIHDRIVWNQCWSAECPYPTGARKFENAWLWWAKIDRLESCAICHTLRWPYRTVYVQPLKRQLSVCSFDGAARLTAFDKDYWHVISICGPLDHKAVLPRAKSIYYACFDDVENPMSEHHRAPREADIIGILDFLARLESKEPGAPLLIHCQQGISRSTAIAFILIFRSLPDAGDRTKRAVDLLLKLRPQAKPNRLILTLGLAQFLPPGEVTRVAEAVLSDPRIQKNQIGSVGW
jgi:predicted protein tyrosine phosphatase